MRLYELLDADFQFADARGELVQLVHHGYEQINILTTHAGAERGTHYHKETKEAFYVVTGKVKVVFEGGNTKEEAIFSKGDFFCVLPFTKHTMFFLEETVMCVMYDVPVERGDGEKDIYSD